MKKILILLTLWLATGATASASDIPIDIRVNGEYIITDSEPVIISGTTYAPVRSIAEALNAEKVSWDEESKTTDSRTKQGEEDSILYQ